MRIPARKAYVLIRSVSTKLPQHEVSQVTIRCHSTGSVVKYPILEFKKNINVRIMSKHDLQMVAGWAAKEGWNPGKYEVEPLYAADPRGYKILEVDGEPIASLASVKHSDDFAFLGLYIVKPEFRGKGYGKLLWDVSMGTLVDCETIGLNAVLNQVDNYGASGFSPAHLNTRWRGMSVSLDESHSTKDIVLKSNRNFSFSKLVDYDAKIFSTPRAAFLKKWLAMPESHTLAAISDGALQGYGVVSAALDGYKIAPLFANNEAIADKIYQALCHCVGEGKTIYLDTVEANPAVMTLAKRFGLEKTFDTLRMYRGLKPQTEDDKVFGLTTLEIG